jgi:hypothetical protein
VGTETPRARGWTRKQADALSSLRHAAEMNREPHGTLTADATDVADGWVYINWQTAMALERHGLAVIDWGDPGAEIWLTEQALERADA